MRKRSALDSALLSLFGSFNPPVEKKEKKGKKKSKGDTYKQTAQMVQTSAGRDNKTVCLTIVNEFNFIDNEEIDQ